MLLHARNVIRLSFIFSTNVIIFSAKDSIARTAVPISSTSNPYTTISKAVIVPTIVISAMSTDDS